MKDIPTEADWSPAPVPETSSLRQMREAARGCTACHLYRRATRTVFGEGPKRVRLMLLGEQPGDQEDVFWEAVRRPPRESFWIAHSRMQASGAMKVYVTNTVKHFKWEPRGKRRIHQKPNAREIAACRPLFEAELRLIKPKLLVCLGATAGQAIFGPSFRVTRERGRVLESELASKIVATVNPSSLLRQPDKVSREL